MSVHIPPGFPSWLVNMLLGNLPVADPGAMRRDADAWVATAHGLGETTLLRLEALRTGHAATAIQGASGDAIRKQLDRQVADTKTLIAQCSSNAERLYEAANTLEFTQYVIIGTGVALLVST